MKKYRVFFQYGSWKLWTDIESPEIATKDRIGFADLAQNAVKIALDTLSQVERKHIAHDYSIFELTHDMEGNEKLKQVYVLETLVNE
jgi:hypothetical protein